MKRPHMGADGMYLIAGKKYEMVRGSRAQVWHGTAYKTTGGLTKDKLLMNKHGRIVSKKKHQTEKKRGQLAKLGFKPKKGTFKAFKKSDGVSAKGSKTRRRRR